MRGGLLNENGEMGRAVKDIASACGFFSSGQYVSALDADPQAIVKSLEDYLNTGDIDLPQPDIICDNSNLDD